MRLRRAFAYHPSVEVTPLSGNPPAEYRVTYKVTTLAIDEAGALAYVASCPVYVWLPPHFPHTAPVVRPMAAAFHPNVSMEWIHLNPAWRPDASLVEVVTQVGYLLAYQSYDPSAAANPVAMNWVYANPHLLPTDPAADFSPAAGGGPLVRLMRFGNATIQELKGRLESACERLVTAAPPPTPEELDELARETTDTVDLFAEPDVPEHLRSAAAELEMLEASLRADDSVWSRIGRQMATARGVAAAADAVAAAEEALRRALAAEGSAEPHGVPPPAVPPAGAEGGPVPTAARLPPPSLVHPLASALRRAVQDAERAVADLRRGLGELSAPPKLPAAPTHGGALERRLQRELSRLAAALEPARASGAVLASLEPVLHRAARESAAVDRLAAWADHADLLRRGNELVERVVAAGPAALQAYSTEGQSDHAGPFEYEQSVNTGGGTTIAVWNLRSRLIRVIDVETEQVIARGDGTATLEPAGGVAPAAGAPRVNIVVAEHTDELRVQLEYLQAQSREALARLRPGEDEPAAAEGPATWAGRLVAELDDPAEQAAAEEAHARAAETWRTLAAELGGVGRFKQRLATYHLLSRLTAFASRARSERERLVGVVARADTQLAQIGSRSGRDAETDQLIIPNQYASTYATHLAERDEAARQARRLDDALDRAAERVRLRLAKPRLYGSAELPTLRLLPPVPQAYVELQPRLSADSIRPLAARLGELLGKPLGAAAPDPGDAARGDAGNI